MKLIDKTISKHELKKMSEVFAGGLVKAVVDVQKEITSIVLKLVG